MISYRLLYVLLAVTLRIAIGGEPAPAPTGTPPVDSPEQIAFFEKKIRPVLIQSCYECHSVESKKSKGGLLLDSKEAMLAGGTTGPALVPGKPDESLLIKALRYADQDFQMPPKQRLPPAMVADFETWIRNGAADPRAKAAVVAAVKPQIDLEAGRKHWAFQPISSPAAPKVRENKRVRNPIDAFLQASLEAKKIQPAPEADKATLLRRLSFDLTGLPPTLDEQNAFLSDNSKDAFEKAVERYLASPRYGERWARHWLDLVRYADSNGVDEDVGHPTAWRYRDYVVRSFNADKPYNTFIVEQLAGDLLGGPSDNFIATAWLSLGPKMLAEPDLEKMKLDIADEQIDVVTKTFLGLTVSCARCHDHKFDPISAADYYALAGIFRSVSTISNYGPRPATLFEHTLPEPQNDVIRAEHAKKLEAAKTSVAEAERAQPKDEKKLKELKEALKKLEAGPDLARVMGVKETEPRDLAIHLRGNHLNLAKEKTPRGFPKVLEVAVKPVPIDPKKSGRMELARWITDPSHPLTARVMVNRLWQSHFGEGLMRTPSNFGIKGEAPDNPALLDWLAQEFIRNGWSVKHMHRLIVTSAAWRRSSLISETHAEKDPENRLFAHQNRRRLEAEAVRDALLSAGGTLDFAMGGEVPGAGKTYSYYDGKDSAFQSPRRTLYLPVPRHKAYELLAIFDYADTAVHLEKRPVTTVPQQALFMLNDPLVRAQAKALAQRVLQAEQKDRERITLAWKTLFARTPVSSEMKTVQEYLARFASQGRPTEAAWTNVLHGLLASNEFVFVD